MKTLWSLGGHDPNAVAGIQADLLTARALDVTCRTLIASFTAQSDRQVALSEPVPGAWLKAQWDVLRAEEQPAVIKLGLLNHRDQLVFLREALASLPDVPVIADPVLASSSGHSFADDALVASWRELLLPRLTLLTPNIPEAEGLLGYPIRDLDDMIKAAAELRSWGLSAVLIKGGHRADQPLDYFDDGQRAFWLFGKRVDKNYRGTGCTLATAIACQLVKGFSLREAVVSAHAFLQDILRGSALMGAPYLVYEKRSFALPGLSFEKPDDFKSKDALRELRSLGMTDDFKSTDAPCELRSLGMTDDFKSKDALRELRSLGMTDDFKSTDAPRELRSLGMTDEFRHPQAEGRRGSAIIDAKAESFPRIDKGRIGFYPIVPDLFWLKRLVDRGVPTIQLRIKDLAFEPLKQAIFEAVDYCRNTSVRLFINDSWQIAIEAGAYGVHLGQEDLDLLTAADLNQLRASGLRLGLSTHCYEEAARSIALQPSYIALGPIFETTCKSMAFGPQGMERVREWQALCAGIPLVAIGGLKLDHAPTLLSYGASGLSVITDVLQAKDPDARTQAWLDVFPRD